MLGNLAEAIPHFICVRGDILREEFLGRLHVAFGWWVLFYWCWCVPRTNMSLTVRS